MSGQHIVVKVGSQVLCDEHGALDLDVLGSIAGQIARLHDDGWKVLLVSSGAVAAGSAVVSRGAAGLSNPVVRKQVLAAAGQVELMQAWRQHLDGFNLPVAQVLTSRSDFQTRRHYLNMRGCIDALLEVGMVPVVNENDVVSVTELMFTDNDELAGLLAAMVDADLLCLLSSVPGVLDGDPASGNTRRIVEWDEASMTAESVVQQASSALGRGGMHSKLNVAREAARLGTEVVIADGADDDILLKIAAGEPVGTVFPPAMRPRPRAAGWPARNTSPRQPCISMPAPRRRCVTATGSQACFRSGWSGWKVNSVRAMSFRYAVRTGT